MNDQNKQNKNTSSLLDEEIQNESSQQTTVGKMDDERDTQ